MQPTLEQLQRDLHELGDWLFDLRTALEKVVGRCLYIEAQVAELRETRLPASTRLASKSEADRD